MADVPLHIYPIWIYESFKLRLPRFTVKTERLRLRKIDYVYIGMDIHKETHTAVLMNYMEERIGEIKIKNNVTGFQRLHAYVEKMKADLVPMYGLEDVTHFGRNLAIYLQERDCMVKHIWRE